MKTIIISKEITEDLCGRVKTSVDMRSHSLLNRDVCLGIINQTWWKLTSKLDIHVWDQIKDQLSS